MVRQSTKQQTSSATKGIKKSHYPSVKFSLANNNATSSHNARSRSASKATAHTEKPSNIVQLVQDICTAEEKSIVAYFEQNNEIPNRAIIQNVLTSILQQLPAKLQALGANSIEFQPELGRQERALLNSKRQRLRELELLSHHLRELDENKSLLRDETGLWLGQIPKEVMPTVPQSSQVTEIAGQFKSQLESMNANCDEVLQFAQECRGVSQKAHVLHDKLYDTFNQLRKVVPSESLQQQQQLPTDGSAAATVPPSDTKDLLRAMPRFYR